MPTLAVAKTYLFGLLFGEVEGAKYTQEQFDNLCFEFGVELDEVTSQREIFRKEHAVKLQDPAQKKALEKQLLAITDEELYKIDTPANRYDLLCAEGMAMALRVFKGAIPNPNFRVLPATTMLTVKPSVRNVREFVVCAVLRNITFNQSSYNSFIDFQEKLHGGLARKRTLASVGTHDMDKVKGPFTFQCVPKEQVNFVPLNQEKMMRCAGEGLAEFYAADRHISKYVPLISKLEKYPVIMDAEETIMSLPPIINSHHSRITKDTKNIFIECTAPDYHKASMLVDQIVTAFSEYCEDKFTVEAVDVKYEDPTALEAALQKQQDALVELAKFREDNTPAAQLSNLAAPKRQDVDVTPKLALRFMNVNVDVINSRVGISSDAATCALLLNKMMLNAEVVDSNTIRVGIPVNRSDVLHPCDLVEDVAIAYGYDNIVKQEVPTRSAGTQTPMNKLVHLIRLEIAAAGYTEMLTFSLCSKDEAFKNLRREDTDVAVHIANPQTMEFQVCRPSLLPGTLKTFASNKSAPLPLKLFEVSDVILIDDSTVTGTVNERHFAALHAQTDSSSFEDVHGIVEYLMMKVGVAKKSPFETVEKLFLTQGVTTSYRFESSDADKVYLPGRAMAVHLDTVTPTADGKGVASVASKHIGCLGVLHPDVLAAAKMLVPCSYAEVNLDDLLHL
jgi:phenylalanyl-tRNA synthetase beta chain